MCAVIYVRRHRIQMIHILTIPPSDTYLADCRSVYPSLPHCCLTLSTHAAKRSEIYLSLWLHVDHLIKPAHNTQSSVGPALLEHDNCSCRIDIVFVQTEALCFPPDRTVVIPPCSAPLWQSHTKPITAEQ